MVAAKFEVIRGMRAYSLKNEIGLNSHYLLDELTEFSALFSHIFVLFHSDIFPDHKFSQTQNLCYKASTFIVLLSFLQVPLITEKKSELCTALLTS